ncbi:MAG: O-methyltransferase [Acholeplasma sp.]|nr:O-methyltransferase [Acholeplasma sp.]
MEEILNQALEFDVPIMQEEGIKFLINFIKENNIKNILEFGSAIGYSAINMALISNDIEITTIERDTFRYSLAVSNINKFNLEKQITIINDDVFNFEVSKNYDLVFIDAAKAQNTKFFEKVANNTKYIITDNLSFHGLVGTSIDIKSRNLRGLVRKIENYIEFLKSNKEFETKFYQIGDGIAVSKKII